MVDNTGKILHKNMNVVFLYALLAVGACFWHANCYKIDEETKMIFREACENANLEVQRAGALQQPVVKEIQRPTPSPAWSHSTALYFALPYMLFDPLNQFSSFFKSGVIQLLCPLCLRDGVQAKLTDSVQWKNGNLKRIQPRLLHDVGNPIVLISKLYNCDNGHREVVACDPDIVKQIPDSLVCFITSHKSGVTKNLLFLCEQLLDKGISLASIEDLHKERYEMMYKSMKNRFLTDLKNCRFLGYSSEDITIPNLNDLCWSFAGSSLLSSAIISNFQRDEDKYRELFSSLTAEWISCDHTYKSVANVGYQRSSDGKWIQQYTALFIIVNEKGQPLQWRFTKTEKFEEVSSAFRQLGDRFKQQGLKQLKGIFTDTCCKWASKFADIFPGVPVKLDLFHAVQRFTSSIPKRKQYHAQIARDYSLVFRAPTDLGEKRLENTPDSRVLLENMDKFEKKWQHVKYSNGENVLNANVINEIKNIKVHIRKGCLSGISPGCGTNRNERLNRHLNEFLLNNKISTSLAYARCFRLFSKLKSMDTVNKDMFTSPSLSDDATANSNDANSHVRHESFAIDDANTLGNCENIERKPNQVNINMFSDSNVTEVARNIQALLAAEKHKESLSSLQTDKNFIEHDYAVVEDQVEIKDQINSLNILHNAICLWRTYIQLSKTFGKKVVDYETIGINTRNPATGLVDFTPDKETVTLNSVYNPSAQDNTLEHIASAWGFQVVDIPGDGNSFLQPWLFIFINSFPIVAVNPAQREII